MELKRLLTDEDAVSPVISVILMVALVVILGAVVGLYVVGTGAESTQGDPAPSVRLEFSYDGTANELTITHGGGETVARDTIEFNVVGSTATVKSDFPDEKVKVDDEAVLSGVETDHKVQVFWNPPESEKRKHRLGQWVGPDYSS